MFLLPWQQTKKPKYIFWPVSNSRITDISATYRYQGLVHGYKKYHNGKNNCYIPVPRDPQPKTLTGFFLWVKKYYLLDSLLSPYGYHRWPPRTLNPILPGGGGGGAENARADFNFWELPWYLSNTYQMWPLLLKFIGEQDSGKFLRQWHHILPWQPRFWHRVYSNFDFFNIFSPLINEIFKTRANY